MVRAKRSMLQSLMTLAPFFLCTVKAECPTAPTELDNNVILSDEAVVQNEFPDGSVVKLECDNGYVPEEGNNTITCDSGSWTKVELRCTRKNCGPPKVIPHLTFEYQNGENGTYFRDRIRAICEPGFQLVGSGHWQCLNHGWKGKSACKEIMCGAARLDTLPALENGRIIKAPLDKEHIQFGDSIQYSCNDDYHLTGNDTIKCTENGYTELPKCEVTAQRPSKTPKKEPIESSVSVSKGAAIAVPVLAVFFIVSSLLICHCAGNRGSYDTQEGSNKMGKLTKRKSDNFQDHFDVV